MHSNTSLMGVQKFNYLRPQLQEDVTRLVIGFRLTIVKYGQSEILLRDSIKHTI